MATLLVSLTVGGGERYPQVLNSTADPKDKIWKAPVHQESSRAHIPDGHPVVWATLLLLHGEIKKSQSNPWLRAHSDWQGGVQADGLSQLELKGLTSYLSG